MVGRQTVSGDLAKVRKHKVESEHTNYTAVSLLVYTNKPCITAKQHRYTRSTLPRSLAYRDCSRKIWRIRCSPCIALQYCVISRQIANCNPPNH